MEVNIITTQLIVHFNGTMNAWDFLRSLHEVCHFQTRERKRVGEASVSELKRWIQNKALIVNGKTVEWNKPMDFPIISIVLFPKHPITIK